MNDCERRTIIHEEDSFQAADSLVRIAGLSVDSSPKVSDSRRWSQRSVDHRQEASIRPRSEGAQDV